MPLQAFTQRCRDLQDICDAAQQFAPAAPLPVFGGARGSEFERAVLEVRTSFAGLLGGLQRLTYDILDIKAARWARAVTGRAWAVTGRGQGCESGPGL